MKICLVGTLPEAGRDALHGPERTTIGLAEALTDRGHDVTVIADEGDSTVVDTNALVLPIKSPPGISRTVELAARLAGTVPLDSYDVVHSWRPAPAVDVLSLHGIAMAEQVEARFPGTFSRQFVVGAKLDLYAKLLTSRRAQKTVVTAHRNAEDARRYGFSVDHEIPVGVSEEFCQTEDSDEDNAIDVLTVSRLERRKQPHFVAAQTPEDYVTRLVGRASDDAYVGQIENLEERWIGALSTDELLRAYRRAKVFVLPSYFEPFGLTAAEAMAASTAVVVADTCAISEFVDEHELGVVYRFDDGDSYRSALKEVFSDRERYARNAQEFVAERLTWSAIAAEYERVYEDIA